MFFLLWCSPTVDEGRLWERLRIYSGKYLFNKSKFYLEKFLNSEDIHLYTSGTNTGRKVHVTRE